MGRPHRAAVTALILVGLPALAHVFLSRYGFNPTDDGFILAQTRRLLDGAVPHRDFVALRPVGSPLLHLPEVWLGGDWTLLLGRAVFWLELGVIAWSWLEIGERVLGEALEPLERLGLGAVAFALEANDFPIMPWHTVDGVLLASLGLAILARGRPALGLLVVGAAATCKQNFGAIGVVALVASGAWRRPLCWAAVVAVPALYAGVIIAAGGGPAMVEQLRAINDLRAVGLAPYEASNALPWGVGLGLGLALLERHAALLALALLLDGVICAPRPATVVPAAFQAFGVVLGVAAGARFRGGGGTLRLAVLALGLAWTASLSLGMMTPTLGWAALAVALIMPFRPASGAVRRLWLVAPAAVALVGLLVVRPTAIYRDRPKDQLQADLGAVLPGARGIVTNRTTAAFFADLGNATRLYVPPGQRYAVVPDCAAWWVAAAQPNPLLVDWAIKQEVVTPPIRAEVLDDLDRKRGRLVVLVQRLPAPWLAGSVAHLRPFAGYSPVVDHVRQSWRLVATLAFFEVYV
jgi:hypothetical protein